MVDDELEPLITRCPNCNTQFRVTENQLAIASGRVRCGACLTVFQGIEHLILDEDTQPFSTGSEADAALDALLDELEPGEQLEIDSGPGDDVHPVAKTEGGTRLFGGFEDVAQTREVDTVDAADTADIETVDEDADAAPEAETEAETEAGTASLVADGAAPDSEAADSGDDAELSMARTEAEDQPEPEPDAEQTGADGYSNADAADEEQDYERWIGRSTASIDQLVEEVVASGRAAVRDRDGAAAIVAPQPEAADPDAAVARPERSSQEISFAPEPRRWWAVGVAALFVVLLLVQIAYLQLPEWSREPSLRPAYETVCGWLGCELPEMRAIEALRTRNLVVRTHPGTGGALIVDAAIVNTAPFAQRFPDLELRFTSVNGELVAGRRFSPDEYLPEDFEGERAMPPNTPIQVSLEIVDPGPDAVNYTLSFR
ncbi:MAG: DUF3426 domain-containing protein [Pseudomonadales bacterium]